MSRSTCATRGSAGGASPSEPIEDAIVHLVRDRAIEPAERAEQTELRQIVRDGVAGLPAEAPERRRPLLPATACRSRRRPPPLNVRLGTVKSRLHYALRKLRTHLEDDRRFEGSYGPIATEARTADR